MTQNFETLQQRLFCLKDNFSGLGARLEQAGKALQECGAPLDENIVAEISACRCDFIELRAQIVEHAQGLSSAALPTTPEPFSLKDLEILLAAAADAKRKMEAAATIHQNALKILDRVQAIVHVNYLDFPPLQEQQAKALALRGAIADAPAGDLNSACKSLVEGTHPFNALLTLVEHHQWLDEKLDSEGLDALQEAVESLPSGKTLFRAAWKGKLVIPAESTATTPLPTAVEPTLMAPSATEFHELENSQFFPARLKTLVTQLDDEKSALQTIRAQSEPGAEIFRLWLSAKKSQAFNNESEAQRILTFLGFNPLHLAITKVAGRTWLNVIAEPIKDRNLCPVPTYGAGAKGHYRFLCVWDMPIAEALLSHISEASNGPPVIVFYFGVLPEKERRHLAQLCRERRRTFIVIDDALLFYLCGEAGPLLPILFKCALPFTFLEPYITAAGLLPPEMFYGRHDEREAIIDPQGACFIYGGRRLGKTALLRHVEQVFHAPREGRIALWLDLKIEGIGQDRAIDAIWELLAAEMNKLKVIDLSPYRGVDRILKGIWDWLAKDAQRRILLLLDEADQFLEADGKDKFVRSGRLKSLMDRSDRRFKVVFAGSHNVLRTATQSNHPLAQHGKPICIGPLSANGEAQEARDLIELPLQSLGYCFESPDLAMRMLSQTDYHPSLIQLYCQQLLEHVAKIEAAAGPPFVITARHVDEVYRSEPFTTDMRRGFNLTLQLDQRYEVIAYAMALACRRGQNGLPEGFDLSWIREKVLTWWPGGFRESATDESIRALLDEMVGLGVLWPIKADRYTLRSANLVSLLGAAEQIEKELQENREAPAEYEPATFRSAYHIAGEIGVSQRSPLTAQQEAELRDRQNGVTIILGCNAAGLSALGKFVESAFGKDFVTLLGDIPTDDGFKQNLSDLCSREQHGRNLVLVMPTCFWDAQWVEEAIRKIQELKSPTSFWRIVFLANPHAAWQLVGDDPARLATLVSQGVTHHSLKPWHDAALRQWLLDCSLLIEPKVRDRITAVTGNWPMLLQDFYKRAGIDQQRWLRYLQEWNDSWLDQNSANTIAKELIAPLGLDCEMPTKTLHDLAIAEQASAEELVGVMDKAAPEMVTRSLRWAELLSLVTPTGNNRWRVNSLVKRVLESFGS
jgi:hypothetical protein